MAATSLPKTLRYRSSGAIAAMIVMAFFGPVVASPLYAGAQALDIPKEVAIAVIAAIALLVGALVFFWFSTECVVVVDALGIRVTRQSVVGPIRGKLQVEFETRWDQHRVVYDQTGVQQTKHGTQRGYSLVMGTYAFPSAYLGTGERDGLYRELLDAVRAAVGDKLQERQNLGPLDDAVRKLVDEQVAARTKKGDRDAAG